VEIYAVGTIEQLRALAAELARGPSVSSVERVEEEAAEMIEKYSREFSIEPGA
jgi:acylphosphatase